MTRRVLWKVASWLAVAAAGVLVRKGIAAAARARNDERIDEALDESFPASDPPSYSASGSQVNDVA